MGCGLRDKTSLPNLKRKIKGLLLGFLLRGRRSRRREGKTQSAGERKGEAAVRRALKDSSAK